MTTTATNNIRSSALRAMPRLTLSLSTALVVLGIAAALRAAEPPDSDFDALARAYATDALPLVSKYCTRCHSQEKREGNLELESFTTFAEVRSAAKAWVQVADMLKRGEMPPPDAPQPTPAELATLRAWVTKYIDAEALASAGDPGPVVLRRLNNAEYAYTVKDLIGVDIDPTRGFPTDSAAGEGFTNTGNALVMSPALLRKYLDAGEHIAQHAVLLPDGFRFSPNSTRRDWTDEILAAIRAFYERFTESSNLGVGSAVGNIEVHRDTRLGRAGRLPLERYFTATLAERTALTSGKKTLKAVAREYRLNARYLKTLWSHLIGTDASLLLDELRMKWRQADASDAAAIAGEVAAWQKGLWTFGPVGLIGRQGSPRRWMEPIDPVATRIDLRLSFPAPPAAKANEAENRAQATARRDTRNIDDGEINAASPMPLVVSLVVTDAGDGNASDFVVWKRPRLVANDQPDILLREVRARASIAAPSPRSDTKSDEDGYGLDPALFGRHPDGNTIDPESICVQAPSVITFRLPAAIASGRDLVTAAVLHHPTGNEGSVQVELVRGVPDQAPGLLPSSVVVKFSRVTHVFSDRREVTHSRPILVDERSAARSRFESAFATHRRLFPAALCYTQIVPVDEVLTLALFYREDDHLVRLMLDSTQRAALDRLWDELHYVSQSAFQRVDALEILLEVMQGSPQFDAVRSLRTAFRDDARRFEEQLIDSERDHVHALVDFAAWAYRRPLAPVEEQELRALYGQLRHQGMTHDEAIRLGLSRVFVSAPFLYKLEAATSGEKSPTPVTTWELANRLSYFLWSGPPDDELRDAAARGSLHTDTVLIAQARRMLTDARVRRLATEFVCQWLHIYEFDQLDQKSDKHFPEFAALRAGIYEEAIRFFTDLLQRDASLLTLLNADYTFVNSALAEFYALDPAASRARVDTSIDADADDDVSERRANGNNDGAWRRVEGMRRYGRGGILGLAAILAKQSGASRTSPILRGNWVSEVLLGEKLPRPPQDVPELPADELTTEGLTVRELVAKHTSDPNCASCHQRIDPFGFALETFDAIGRRRDMDLGGRPIDTQATLPDGTSVRGLDGLRDYLLTQRRPAFVRQFCRKLLGYAIGREIQLSDRPLLETMEERLVHRGYRLSAAVEAIVLSDQFRTIRPAGRRDAKF